MSEFTVYPAIDVREGRVVRLHKGDYDKETSYADDPVAVAESYARAGARWLHLVDLDAARAGGYTLEPVLREIVDRTGLQVQTGGGVRSAGDVERLLEAGATRVVVGSVAVREPETVTGWLQRFGPERLTVALDTRTAEDGSWVLPVSGWTSVAEQDLPSVLGHYAADGLRHLLCTDIGRDGTLAGPNLNLYTMLTRSAPQVRIQASGGARHVPDVRGTRKVGCAGIVLGKAILEGRLTVTEAVAEERV
ncbi:1-(5-phosphoribosyl)-5-[(5-phosphoribosylamino)methylideneamino]imidazole-4-carboxamide isomerase [Ornithinicoccus halotolerans]|uniref:1-(5-phosphoribosyl)-5-[(5- phosphoribosylamino)methylideneamino]imidazole-4- carboxamide isomerase n=1 Tax=Ornithinicoccus halotolerans TaxID=1748220 RepID=UPI00129644D5|nr:1-(5-phosphoribosyl)-5-[(5-phosphoribosylamino)methylideneamino]imidazole-4-carboxamide isomerase [Ornithinicoccus halotolerans]